MISKIVDAFDIIDVNNENHIIECIVCMVNKVKTKGQKVGDLEEQKE